MTQQRKDGDLELLAFMYQKEKDGKAYWTSKQGPTGERVILFETPGSKSRTLEDGTVLPGATFVLKFAKGKVGAIDSDKPREESEYVNEAPAAAPAIGSSRFKRS